MSAPVHNKPSHRPRFGKIEAAASYCGFGRTKLYEMAAEYPSLFRKAGRCTLVDFDCLDALLDKLPSAKIRKKSF
jgi:hypothetical protein